MPYSRFASSFRAMPLRRSLWIVIVGACAELAPSADADGPAATAGLRDVGGVKLYTQIYGVGAPIVFLHGGLHFFENSFQGQRDFFASYRKVIGIDQPGHGRSPDDGRPLSYKVMADNTAALIEQLGVGPVDVVGHSDGGNVGLLLARDHPALVRRLVISGANIRSGLSPDEAKRRSQRSAQEVSDKLPPVFRADYVKVTPDGADHWLTMVAKSQQLWLTPVVIEPAELKTLKMPVLVIAGDRDFTPIEETVEIFRNLPQGQLLIVPATGHGTFSERPAFMNEAIRTFLEQPVPASR